MSEQQFVVRPHWRAFGVWYLAILLFGLGPLQNPDAPISGLQGVILSIIVAAGIAYHGLTSRLTVTRGELTRSGGLISRGTRTIPMDGLRQVKVQRGLIHAALGVGVLVFIPASSSGEVIKFWGAANPAAVRRRIESMAGLAPGGSGD